MNDPSIFKITLRGYERAAVEEYIDSLKAEDERKVQSFQQELAEVASQKAELQIQLEEGESLRREMQSAMTGAQDFITAQANKLKTAERELEDAKKKNALYLDKQDALTRLLAEAQVKCGSLVEEAQQHANKLLAEAQQQAEEITEKASANAATMIAESKKDAEGVQTALRRRLATITDTVSAIRQLTAQVGSCCDAADQMIADPDSFFYEETGDRR